MYSKNHRPTKAQKEFWDWLAGRACVFCSSPMRDLHHVLGASSRENKIPIGQWVLVPVCGDCHDNIHQWSKLQQIEEFMHLLNHHWRIFGELPMSKDELMAIVSWRR